MKVFNFAGASEYLGFKSCVAVRRLHCKGLLDACQTFGSDRRSIYLEIDSDGTPSLREHVHPHQLRHGHAINAVQRGVDVFTLQVTLGHSSSATEGGISWLLILGTAAHRVSISEMH